MKTYCKVTACGNTTAIPRFRTVKEEREFATVTLAVNDTYTLGESFVEETNYVDCVFYGAFARALKDLPKGTKLYIEGRGKTSTWKDRETGKTRFRFEVVVEKVKRIPSPKDLAPSNSIPTSN